MNSKKNHEGWLMIDHRASPGVSAEFVRGLGFDPENCGIAGEGEIFEAATITCSHCQTVLLKNPTRTRERGYCAKCDHYICDPCAAEKHLTGECNLARKRHDNAQEQAFLGEQRGSTILLTSGVK